MPNERKNAKVGPLKFHPDFHDPIVDVSIDARTTTHETINGNNIVQVLGQDPPEIAVEGIVYDWQLDNVDKLVETEEIPVLTERWTGMAVVEAVDTSYRREADPSTGTWIYDVNIDLLGVRNYLGDGSRDDIHPSDRKLYEAAEEITEQNKHPADQALAEAEEDLRNDG